MRALEIIVALIVAAILFVVLKLVGVVIKIAAIAALFGLVAGYLLARAFQTQS